MKKQTIIPFLLLIAGTLSSCAAVEGIFKAGFWAGFIFVVVIIVVIVAALAAMFRKK